MKTSLILAILPLSIWVEFFMAPLLDTEYICIFDILIDLIQPLRLFLLLFFPLPQLVLLYLSRGLLGSELGHLFSPLLSFDLSLL